MTNGKSKEVAKQEKKIESPFMSPQTEEKIFGKDFHTEDVQRKFVKKVYTVLLLGWTVTALVMIYSSRSAKTIATVKYYGSFWSIATFALLFSMKSFHSILIFIAFCVCEGVQLSSTAFDFGVDAPLVATAVTLFIFGCLTALGFFYPVEYNELRKLIIIFLILVSAFAMLFLISWSHLLGILLAFTAACLFSTLILFNTKEMIEASYHPQMTARAYLRHAICLNIYGIFLFLSLFGLRIYFSI